MGSLYGEAKRVIIWLGEATYDTDYVMYYMKKLEKKSFKYASNGQEISEWVNIWSVVVRNLRPDQRDLLVEGLQSLLHRSWFKRVWIIQEAANAQVAEIVCGGKSISASIFAFMPTLLKIIPEPHCQPILDITDLLRADYGKNLEDTIFNTTSFLFDLNELGPPIYRFFDWTLQEFLRNLDVLANEVLK
jgi:hypothetical protein